MIGFVVIISICVGVILRNVLYPAAKTARIYSKAERELNEILMQEQEDRIVEHAINTLAFQQFSEWKMYENNKGLPCFIIRQEYGHSYHVYHYETAKYVSNRLNISAEIQKKYKELCDEYKTNPHPITWQTKQ